MKGNVGNWLSTVATALIMLIYCAVVPAGEELDGPELYLKYNCQICHGNQGEGGVRNGYPVISGQDKRYLIDQMKDIRDGIRETGNAKVMRPLVKELTDEEIRLIAAFLSERR
jgi:cytochrome c